MTHQPGIDEGKIDGLTLHFSFYAFQGTRAYDARPQLRRVCYTHEERDVNRRGEMWISEAFHLTNLPTISHQGLQNSALSCLLLYTYTVTADFMQPLSFLLLIASLAFALPVEGAEHKLLTPESFSNTIAEGYW